VGRVGAGGDSANVCERKSKGGLGSFGKLKVPFENVEAGAHVGAQVVHCLDEELRQLFNRVDLLLVTAGGLDAGQMRRASRPAPSLHA
jgi:hypothetical protein